MRAVWVAAISMIASPALAVDRFDMQCSSPKSSERYRIDLVHGEWCAGDCSVIKPVAKSTSETLVLEDRKPEYRDDVEASTIIDRVTGEWRTDRFDPKLDLVPFRRVGSCVVANFSRFPAPRP